MSFRNFLWNSVLTEDALGLGLRKSQLQPWGARKAFKFVNWDAKDREEITWFSGVHGGDMVGEESIAFNIKDVNTKFTNLSKGDRSSSRRTKMK